MNIQQAALSSMQKTSRLLAIAAVLAAGGAVVLAAGGGTTAAFAAGLLAATAVAVAWLAGAGRLVWDRQRRIHRGEPDLFIERNAARSEAALRRMSAAPLAGWRRAIAATLFGQRLLVGDTVVVGSLDQIRATLDADGCIDGLPFLREMERYCGRTMRVYRVLDKIYDYGRSKLMRRLDDSVLLLDLRCDGSDHGGCEAACYLIWKSAWLRRVEASTAVAPPMATTGAPAVEPAPPAHHVYRCQYTALTAASRPMRQTGLRPLLAPLVFGNVTFAAFSVAVKTRCFNAIQVLRGGATYPAMPTPTDDKSLNWEPLHAGDRVRVKSPEALAPAMNRNSKHRGLWFDRDMLKHCSQERRVLARVGKIIDIHSGRMIPMKTPCIILAGVDYSGEFQGFGEQHDYLYWREAWLEPLGVSRADTQAAVRIEAPAK